MPIPQHGFNDILCLLEIFRTEKNPDKRRDDEGL
jgi:hypothetical protein